MSVTYAKDQTIGAFVHSINAQRQADEVARLLQQDFHFAKAVNEVDKVRQFVGSPENILGSNLTKHGEIAEQVEVGIRNARSYLQGGGQVATFEGVGRLAPEDYLLDGVEVQSKFYNGANNTLQGIKEHLNKYPDFTSNKGFYHMPKDQFEVIDKILKGEPVDHFNAKTVASIRNHIAEIESRTGQGFYDVVEPGVSDYAEIQQGAVHGTLDTHQKDLEQQNKQLKDDIRQAHKPSLAEGAKATGIAAAVGAGVSLGAGFYKHYKEGKNVFKGELTSEDWKELGLDTAKGAVIGGVSGAAMYSLTNYASLSAPFAGAVVSASKGIASLYSDYHSGDITLDDFTSMGIMICAESSIVGLATFAGQTLIPVPVLGAVIGSLAGQVMVNLMGVDSGETVASLNKQIEAFTAKLDAKYQLVVEQILSEYRRLGDLTVAAFDFDLNVSLLTRSVDLARAYGVEEDEILKDIDDVDDYFLS